MAATATFCKTIGVRTRSAGMLDTAGDRCAMPFLLGIAHMKSYSLLVSRKRALVR